VAEALQAEGARGRDPLLAAQGLPVTYDAFIDVLEARGCNPKPQAGGHSAHCPAHQDDNPSFTTAPGTDGILVKCWSAGCEWDEILAALDLPKNALFYDAGRGEFKGVVKQPEGWWNYHDADGVFWYQVRKYRWQDGRKTFQQWHMENEDGEIVHNGYGAKWVPNLKGCPRLLYRLPLLADARDKTGPVYIVDGEKDADEIIKHGRTATCASGGASTWLAVYVKWFLEHDVIIVKDKDPAGDAWAETIYDSLEWIARSRYIVEAKTGKDSFDTLQAHPIEEAFCVLRTT
jgi:hypothetical protein